MCVRVYVDSEVKVFDLQRAECTREYTAGGHTGAIVALHHEAHTARLLTADAGGVSLFFILKLF